MSPSLLLTFVKRLVAFTAFSFLLPCLAYAAAKDDAAAFAALQMKLLLADQQEDIPKPIVMADLETNAQVACDAHNKKVASLLVFIPQGAVQQSRLQKNSASNSAPTLNAEAKHAIKELISLSKNTPFDADCAIWRHNIVQRFTLVRYKNAAYKQGLYAILANNQGSEINTLALEVLNYSLLFGPLSASDWTHLTTSFQHATHQDVKRILDAIILATADSTQTPVSLERQVDDLVMLAKQGQLGQPLNIKEGYVIGVLLAKTQPDLPHAFERFYRQYHQKIDKPVRLEKYLRSYIQSHPSADSYQLLSLFLTDVARAGVIMNRRDANKVFTMLNALKPDQGQSEDQNYKDVWQALLQQHAQIIGDIVGKSQANALEKQYWIDFYQKKPTKVTQLPL